MISLIKVKMFYWDVFTFPQSFPHILLMKSSLVDYLIVHPSMFDFISYFKVEDFNPMFSDVHCRLSFTLLFNTPNKCNIIHHDNNKLKNQDTLYSH